MTIFKTLVIENILKAKFESLFKSTSAYLFSNLINIDHKKFIFFMNSIDVNLTYRLAKRHFACCVAQLILNQYCLIEDFQINDHVKKDLDTDCYIAVRTTFHKVSEMLNHHRIDHMFYYIDWILIFRFLK